MTVLAPFQAIQGWLKESGFRRDATVLFTSTALARGVLLISMPLVARYFSPDEVGSWQLFVSLATVIAVVVCWRYEFAIPLPADEQKARDLVGVSLLVALGMSALFGLVILAFREQFLRWIATPALDDYLWCVPPFVLLIGCEQAAMYWLTRTGNFTAQGLSRLSKSVFTVGLPLGLVAFREAQASLLILGTLLGQLAATALMLRRNMWHAEGGWGFSRARLSRLREAMLEYRNYPLYVAPYAFIGQFAKRLVYFLLASFASSHVVGFFAMAMQITLVPVSFVTSALNQAFYRRASASGDLRQLEPLVVKVLRLQFLLAVPPFIILIVHARAILWFVLGPGWEEAAGYVAWLAVPSLMLFFTAWLDRVFDTLGRQRLAVVLQVCYDAVSLGLLASLLATGHSALASVAAYCLTTAVYNAIWLCITFRIAGFSLRPLGQLLLLGGAVVAFMLGVHGLLRGLLSQPLALTAEASLAILLQLIALRWLRNTQA